MSKSGTLSFAVAGLGFGANHARVLCGLEGVRLAAVCDPDTARLAQVTRFGDIHGYADAATMLRQERLDAVVVAVPARLHVEVALAAIEAGCAVLVEKPLATSLAEGERIADAARVAGVPLMAGHIERFNPAIVELRRRVQAGEVGRVLQLQARRLAYFVARSREFDTGVIHDLAYHDIDVMRFVMGGEVERVFAETQRGVKTAFEDAVTALLRFKPSQAGPAAVGSLEVNRLSPRLVREFSVLGERGLIVASYADFRSPSLEFQAAQRIEDAAAEAGGVANLRGDLPGPLVSLPVEPSEPLRQEHQAFVQALRRGGPMPVTAEDALAALAVACALAESSLMVYVVAI
jgi:predicted dehydrogenase